MKILIYTLSFIGSVELFAYPTLKKNPITIDQKNYTQCKLTDTYYNRNYNVDIKNPAEKFIIDLWNDDLPPASFQDLYNSLQENENSSLLDYWLAFSKTMNNINDQDFFTKSIPLSISIDNKTATLPQKTCEILQLKGNDQVPLYLILTLYIVAYLTPYELNTIIDNKNQQNKLEKKSIANILGNAYDNLLSGFLQTDFPMQ